MKIDTFFTIITSSLLMVGCAGTHQLNPKGKGEPAEKSQEFQLGYKKAIFENANKWESLGRQKAKAALSKYADEIKSIEAGKAARDKNYLDETRAIVIKNPDGSVTIKTVGGKLKNSLNANQIIDYYNDNKYLLPKYNNVSSQENRLTKNIIGNKEPLLLRESFKLESEAYIEQAKGKIADNKALLNQKVQKLAKNDHNKKIIDLYGLNCNSSNSEYSCSFKNQDVRATFCKETGACK